MLFGAPFLAKMVQSMSDWELNLLFGMGIAWVLHGYCMECYIYIFMCGF